MDSELDEAANLHHAGATIRHHSPFQDLKVHYNSEPLDRAFLARYCIPYYMLLPIHQDQEGDILLFAKAKSLFTEDIVHQLLGDFNWRTRQTGAYFAAINNYLEFEDEIGRHLLKSEVCYAGEIYALALASFNSAVGRGYLTQYLDYYLARTELWYDQESVMQAVAYLDQVNGTEVLSRMIEPWKNYIKDKAVSREFVPSDRVSVYIHYIRMIRGTT